MNDCRHNDSYKILIAENRQLFQLIIVEQFGGCLKEKELDSIYTNLALCRLFKERYDLLGERILGSDQGRMGVAQKAVYLVQFIDGALIEELKARGISDSKIEQEIREELPKMRIIIQT